MMDEKLEKMLHDINTNISQSLKEVTDRVSEAEQRNLVVESASTDAEQHLLALEKHGKRIHRVPSGLEKKRQTKNLRIIGLQEMLEGTKATKLMETWIPLPLQLEAGRVKLERAHRLPGPKFCPSTPTRLVPLEYYFQCSKIGWMMILNDDKCVTVMRANNLGYLQIHLI